MGKAVVPEWWYAGGVSYRTCSAFWELAGWGAILDSVVLMDLFGGEFNG